MEFLSKLKECGFSLETWHSLALHFYSEGEFEHCETLLQECIEEYDLLDENQSLEPSGNGLLSSNYGIGMKVIVMLSMLELNMAIGHYQSNFRKSEALLRRCEDRLRQLSKLSQKRSSCPDFPEFKETHRLWGFLYLYKSAIMAEMDFNQRAIMLDNSEKEFTLALELDPRDVQSISGLANVLFQKTSYSRALRLYSTLLLILGTSKCPNSVRLGMACCYLHLGQVNRALECCKRGIILVLQKSGRTDVEPEHVFPPSRDSPSTINKDLLKDQSLLDSLSNFDRQTLADLLLCLSKSSQSGQEKILSTREAFELVSVVSRDHPALVLYASEAEFFLGSGSSTPKSTTGTSDGAKSSFLERGILEISKRCSNVFCGLLANFQLARKFHSSNDFVNANLHYSLILNAIKDSAKTDKSLQDLYFSSLLGVIKTSCELHKWDEATQGIQRALEVLGIKGSVEFLKDFSLPIGYLYELMVLAISLVILSTEDPTSVPRTISIFSQLTVEERLLNCLHYLFFILGKLGDSPSELCSNSKQSYVICMLLQKVVTCLLLRGRRTIRRTDYSYGSISSLISRYTSYSETLNPLPLVVILQACLRRLISGSQDPVSGPKEYSSSCAALAGTPYSKFQLSVRDRLGMYLNNLGVCILECATSLAPEHSKLHDENELLDQAMEALEAGRKWLTENEASKESSDTHVKIVMRFNLAICNELKGFYANANDEYKRLTAEFPWFTPAWLRRACLALERNDFQLAAQYCELSLNSKDPEIEDSSYTWMAGTGNNQESASLLLSHIYSCQRKQEKSFNALSRVLKSKNVQFSNIGKVLLGLALYNKAKTQIQGGLPSEMTLLNPSSVQSRMVASEALRHESHNFIASNLILLQVAESGLVETPMEMWRYMSDMAGATEGAASRMHFLALVNLGVLHAVLLSISTQKYPPPSQHNLTLDSIVKESGGSGNAERRNEVLGSHPHFMEQRRLMKTAVKLFQQALQFDPTEKSIHKSLIRCCFDMNMWEDARELLEKASLRWPSDLTFRIGLTSCLERLVYSEMGDMERAKHPGRVRYWMMLCEAVGGFYHWLSIIKETFQIVDMKFIGQVKNNKLNISSLQKFVPGIVRYGQDNKMVLNTENRDGFRYKLPALPLDGTDLLPNVEYLTKQELIMSRKLYSRFEELLPIVEQVYEKEQRDVEELRIRSEDFRKKQEEERLRREEEERATSERIKLLSIELGKEAESIAASLPDSTQIERRPRQRKDGAEDSSGGVAADDSDDEPAVSSDSDSYSDSGSTPASRSDPGSASESEPDSNGKVPVASRGGSREDSESGEDASERDSAQEKYPSSKRKARGKSGGGAGSEKTANRGTEIGGPKPAKKTKSSKKGEKINKREEKRLLKLRRLEEQTAALLELEREQGEEQPAAFPGPEEEPKEGEQEGASPESGNEPSPEESGQGRSRLKKRRLGELEESD
ncbi:tetratricopeptide repeat-containing protein [Cryptosporidium felis]|nr:tetratricopeptide repeat-containing protein [Cryptosporidium felis]